MSSMCLRCLKRSLPSIEASQSSNGAQRAAFSTSSSLSANPPKKKPVVAKSSAKQGRTLKLAKNKRVTTARPPATGERKALHKRVVLSNTNALEVPGLQDLTKENVSAERLAGLSGKVLGLGNVSVDALRALEAFKPTQGWSLFRRPASLVRAETVDLGRQLQSSQDEKKVVRQILCGDRSSGKSVLMLQGMAIAQLKGYLVLHFPEARDMVIAHTSYRPIKAADGSTIYIQPHYTAQLLLNFAKANHALLSTLRLSKQHQLPVPVQSNISLDRFVELGANDPELAWPVWQALWSELTAPSQPDKTGLERPPVFVSLDGVEHIMRHSAYLDGDANQLHAHELALVRDFTSLMSGKIQLPNGGMVVASTSGSNRVSSPTLDYFLESKLVEGRLEKLRSLRERVRAKAETALAAGTIDAEGLGEVHDELEDTIPDLFFQKYAPEFTGFRHNVLSNVHHSHSPKQVLSLCDTFKLQPPKWDPFIAIDERVVDVMKKVEATKLPGLSKDEARGVMEYYAHSGMLRNTVTDGLVSEKWTLAGNGIIGELEKGAVRARF